MKEKSSNKELHGCVNLVKLLDVEKKIIQRHIKKHKWMNHIEDVTEGTIDFINKFGWVMKEIYCEAVCDRKDDCEIYLHIKELDKT